MATVHRIQLPSYTLLPSISRCSSTTSRLFSNASGAHTMIASHWTPKIRILPNAWQSTSRLTSPSGPSFAKSWAVPFSL